MIQCQSQQSTMLYDVCKDLFRAVSVAHVCRSKYFILLWIGFQLKLIISIILAVNFIHSLPPKLSCRLSSCGCLPLCLWTFCCINNSLVYLAWLIIYSQTNSPAASALAAASLCGLFFASTVAWCAQRAAAKSSFLTNPFV